MGIIKQLDKRTGITYVYESKAYWDKEKHQSRAKRTLIGKIDPETGDELVPFGVEGGTYEDAGQEYKKYRTDDMVRDAMFLIKANAPINTEAHAYVQTQLSSGKIKFLIDQSQAKAKLMQTKNGQNMSTDKRNQYLRPFVLTTVLRQQLLNLVEDNEGVNIILKQNSRGIKKDKFSAFVYGLFFIKQYEDRLRKRKKRDISQFSFFSTN